MLPKIAIYEKFRKHVICQKFCGILILQTSHLSKILRVFNFAVFSEIAKFAKFKIRENLDF